jgi:hypothetical protein
MNEPLTPSKIAPPPLPTCKICGIELQATSAHFSKDQCIRDLQGRVRFLRQITATQAAQLQQESMAIVATHRFAYAILAHFTSGIKAKLTQKKVRAIISRSEFERLPDGAAVTMSETENGNFEVVGVIPEKPPVGPS